MTRAGWSPARAAHRIRITNRVLWAVIAANVAWGALDVVLGRSLLAAILLPGVVLLRVVIWHGHNVADRCDTLAADLHADRMAALAVPTPREAHR